MQGRIPTIFDFVFTLEKNRAHYDLAELSIYFHTFFLAFPLQSESNYFQILLEVQVVDHPLLLSILFSLKLDLNDLTNVLDTVLLFSFHPEHRQHHSM
jgi:hypothetical protein